MEGLELLSLEMIKSLPISSALVSSRRGFTLYRGGMAKAPVLFYTSSPHSWQQGKGRLSPKEEKGLLQIETIWPGRGCCVLLLSV